MQHLPHKNSVALAAAAGLRVPTRPTCARVPLADAPRTQVLLLHLKRFMFDGAHAHKTMTRVEFPETLSLAEFYAKGSAADRNRDSRDYLYQLIGGVCSSNASVAFSFFQMRLCCRQRCLACCLAWLSVLLV